MKVVYLVVSIEWHFPMENVQNYSDLLVLSLGTGQQTVGYTAKQISKWGVRDWLINKGDAPLVDMVYNASADMVDYNLSTIFQSQDCGTNYLRIQVHGMKAPELDKEWKYQYLLSSFFLTGSVAIIGCVVCLWTPSGGFWPDFWSKSSWAYNQKRLLTD